MLFEVKLNGGERHHAEVRRDQRNSMLGGSRGQLVDIKWTGWLIPFVILLTALSLLCAGPFGNHTSEDLPAVWI